MDEVVDESGLSREQAVDRLNRAANQHGVRLLKGNGRALTINTFEKWLNPNDEQRFPLYRALLVFCVAFDTTKPLEHMARIAGAKVVSGQDLKLLEWAREYHRVKESRRKMRKIEGEIHGTK